MDNWKYFLKNAALTAIHVHIILNSNSNFKLNIHFVSVVASNMLTKYKITVIVIPNNILIFNQRFD
jgi:hypothetical protein